MESFFFFFFITPPLKSPEMYCVSKHALPDLPYLLQSWLWGTETRQRDSRKAGKRTRYQSESLWATLYFWYKMLFLIYRVLALRSRYHIHSVSAAGVVVRLLPRKVGLIATIVRFQVFFSLLSSVPTVLPFERYLSSCRVWWKFKMGNDTIVERFLANGTARWQNHRV